MINWNPALPLLCLLLMLSLIGGLMAKSMGRKAWFWFCLCLVLPFIANVILSFLPERSVAAPSKPLENDEMFDHLFLNKGKYV